MLIKHVPKEIPHSLTLLFATNEINSCARDIDVLFYFARDDHILTKRNSSNSNDNILTTQCARWMLPIMKIHMHTV